MRERWDTVGNNWTEVVRNWSFLVTFMLVHQFALETDGRIQHEGKAKRRIGKEDDMRR